MNISSENFMEIIIDYLLPENVTHTNLCPDWAIDTSYNLRVIYGD